MAQKGSKKGSKKAKKAAPRPAKKAVRPVKRSKPVRPSRSKARKKAVAKARKPARAVKKAKPARRPAAKPARRPAAKTAKRAEKARKAAAKPVRKAPPARKTAPAPKAKPAPKPAARSKSLPLVPPPTLQRERRRLPEAEEETFTNTTGDSRLMSSARSGHDELRQELRQHTEASPAMTAGDVDAKWQDAYALGDEAPGGDNMTPDQDRVDDIGKALGIEYADDEELLGGEELVERDEHRWELDPASKEDDEEEI